MRSRVLVSSLRWVSIILLLAAVIVSVLHLVRYSRIRNVFPTGMIIGGIPVAGLDRQKAAERLVQAYGIPIELHYNDGVIQAKPGVLGFELKLESMLTAADQQRTSLSFWLGFWDYLWNRLPSTTPVPLQVAFSDERMKAYLKSEISSRYDQEASPAVPVPGSTNFISGQPGLKLDIDRAITLMKEALASPRSRSVTLTLVRTNPPKPTYQNLQVLLQQILTVSGFEGIADIYLKDLQSMQEINFALQKGVLLKPDIAFTAASSMKIPIMFSVYRRIKDQPSAEVLGLLEEMIDKSENPPADKLMMQVISEAIGPLKVTEDMQMLGLHNTFLAGYFYNGAPLLKRYSTPANQRTDVFTNPDLYNQTTAAEIGMLLDDIYQCASNGGGTFAAVFPGEMNQTKCKQMITILLRNRIGVLIEAGLPEGTQVAHKHGWITEPSDGLIHTISDSGIIYTKGGNFVFTVYLYNKEQLLFEPANLLVAQLSRAIYNYFNLPSS